MYACFQCSVNERWSASGPASSAAPQTYGCIVHTGMTKCSCGDYNYSYPMFAKTLNREVNSLLGEPACRCMKHYCTFWLVKFSQSPDSVDVDAKKKAKKKNKKTSQDYNITAWRQSRERPSDKWFVTCSLRWCNHIVTSTDFLLCFLNVVSCENPPPKKNVTASWWIIIELCDLNRIFIKRTLANHPLISFKLYCAEVYYI